MSSNATEIKSSMVETHEDARNTDIEVGDGDVRAQMVEDAFKVDDSAESSAALRRNSTSFWKPKFRRRLSEQLPTPPTFAPEADGTESISSMKPRPTRSSTLGPVTPGAPRRALKRARNLLTTTGKPLDGVRDIVPGLDEVNDDDDGDEKSIGLLRRHSSNLRKSIKRRFKDVSRSFNRARSVPEPTGTVEEDIPEVIRRRSFSSPRSSLQTKFRHGRSYSEVIDRQHPLIELTPPLSAVPASPITINDSNERQSLTDNHVPLISTPNTSTESSKLSTNHVVIPESLQAGTLLTKISSKKPSKHTKLVFRLDAGRGMIIWETLDNDEEGKKTKFIPVENIREIRTGRTALIHLSQYGMDPPERYIDRWMTLIYVVSANATRSSVLPLSLPVQINASSRYAYSGQSFKTLHLLASSVEDKTMWEHALKGMERVWVGLTGGSGSFGGGLNRDRDMEEMRKGLWERMYWDGIEEGSVNRRKSWGGRVGGGENVRMTFEFAEKLCRRLNVGMGLEDMKRLFEQADTQHRGYLSFEDFQRFVKFLKARPDINRLYKKLLRDCQAREQTVSKNLFTFEVFEYFMKEKQKSKLPTSELQVIFGRYSEEMHNFSNQDMLLSTPSSPRPLPLPNQSAYLNPASSSSKSFSTLPTPPPSSFSTPVMPTRDLDAEVNQAILAEEIPSSDHANAPPPRVMSPESFASFLLSSDNPTLLETRSGVAQGTGSAIETNDNSQHHWLLGHLVPGRVQDKLNNPSAEFGGVTQVIKNVVTGRSPEASNISQLSNLPRPLSEISHDMTRPLSEYYISSSHNTYLLGHQLVGTSTTEGYVRALLSGCRSVELDIFDSDTGPQIFHGKTLTSKVSLREVCEVIDQYGFVASEYPIIISAEVHCGYAGQGMIVDIMKEVFGWRLIRKEKGVIVGMEKGMNSSQPTPEESTRNEDEDEDDLIESLLKDWRVDELPSPEELKGKILLKTKNLFLAARKDNNTHVIVSPPTSPEGLNSASTLTFIDTSTSSTSDTEAVGRRPSYKKLSHQRESDSVVDDIKQEFRHARSVMQRMRSIRSSHKTPPSSFPPSPNKASLVARPTSPSEHRHKYKMNPSLVPLLIYTVGVKCRGINKKEEYAANEIFSLSENTANKMLKAGMIDLIKHTRGHLVRIYPKGTRVSSTNYHPHRYWSGGAQLVAINWQTFDTGYMINHSMFQRNGRSGYVLKPLPLRDPHKEALVKRDERTLDVTIISAQQLPLPRDENGREIVGKSDFDPYVEVTLHVPDWPNPPATSLLSAPNSIASGLMRANEAAYALANSGADGNSKLPMSSSSTQKISYRTNAVKNNRFNPMWEEKLRIPFTCAEGMEELVFVTFAIRQEDKEDEEPLAMFCASLGCLQHGYRHLHLHDAQMAQYLFSTLFVKISLS